MQHRIRVYRTFFLGLLIGLIYAAIVSGNIAEWVGLLYANEAGDVPADVPFLLWLSNFERQLVLIVSGILGGIIYTIMVDGHVELPRFIDERGDRFEAGLLGDMLLGIAGAFILEFLTSPLGASSDASSETFYVTLAAKGIVGGYGSKTLMDIALSRFQDRVKSLSRRKEVAESEHQALTQQVEQLHDETQQLLEGQALIHQLDQHIDRGLTPPELDLLIQSIQKAPPAIREQIFQLAKQFRSTTSRTAEFRASTQRTIAIFEALVATDGQHHDYHAQLAFAYKDADPFPSDETLDKVVNHLNRAIAFRSPTDAPSTWKYELNRAIALIEKDWLEPDSAEEAAIPTSGPDRIAFSADHREAIVADLLIIDAVEGLPKILHRAHKHHLFNPILEWLRYYQPWLEEGDRTSGLLAALNTKSPPDPLQTSKELTRRGQSRQSPQSPPQAIPNPSPPASETLSLDDIKATLQQEVNDAISIQHGSPDLRNAVRAGLVRLQFLDPSLESQNEMSALKQAWASFKESVNQGSPDYIEMIGPATLDALLDALDAQATGPKAAPTTSPQTLTTRPHESAIPQPGIDLIKRYEGFKAKAYKLRGEAHYTIGYGSTRHPDGRDIQKQDVLTKTEAERYLRHFLEQRCRPVLEKIPTWSRMNDNQRSALYSFAYNLGPHFYRGKNYESITRVCDSPDRWNDERWVTEQFVKYRNPGTIYEEGLRKRRQEEAQLFCTPVPIAS